MMTASIIMAVSCNVIKWSEVVRIGLNKMTITTIAQEHAVCLTNNCQLLEKCVSELLYSCHNKATYQMSTSKTDLIKHVAMYYTDLNTTQILFHNSSPP